MSKGSDLFTLCNKSFTNLKIHCIHLSPKSLSPTFTEDSKKKGNNSRLILYRDVARSENLGGGTNIPAL